jgi:AmiR/NasT family two-component response regulator
MTAEVWMAVLTSIPVVGVAQGVLMERLGLTADQAFERLWRMAQSDPAKALEVALAVVSSTG